MRSLIAIVGRPNVGKSRMFNRLARSDRAIVHDYEGVTRDRQYADNEWFGRPYTVIDTGGFVPQTDEPLLSQMREQAQLAIEEAEVIIFVLDARAGLLHGDGEIADMLRRSDRPVFFAVNKIDEWDRRHELLTEFYELGVDLHPVSAEHGHGLDALMDDVAEHLERVSEEELDLFLTGQDDDDRVKICVIGKPNAGKSSTVNAMLGEERLLTSEIPGTTRDAVDTEIVTDERTYLVIDTAGLRRKSRVSQRLERYSVVQALRSINRAQVALLVIDATEGVTGQDKKIASVVANRGRACIILVNKWDLVEKTADTAGEYVKELRYQMPFMEHAPVLFVSAKTGQRVHRVLDVVDDVYDQFTRRIQTSEVNKFLEDVVRHHSPPMHRAKPLKFYYASQVATRPPTFMFVVNHPEGVKAAYRRFLENQLRERYGFEGTPIRTVMRGRRQNE